MSISRSGSGQGISSFLSCPRRCPLASYLVKRVAGLALSPLCPVCQGQDQLPFWSWPQQDREGQAGHTRPCLPVCWFLPGGLPGHSDPICVLAPGLATWKSQGLPVRDGRHNPGTQARVQPWVCACDPGLVVKGATCL